jgi:hypothetical protein
MGVWPLLHAQHLHEHFFIFYSIHSHISAKHGSRIVQKVSDGLQPLICIPTTKPDHWTLKLLFFGANRKQNSHDYWQGCDDGCDLATSNLLRNNNLETIHIDAMQNDSGANVNKTTTTLQIVINFPSQFLWPQRKPNENNVLVF